MSRHGDELRKLVGRKIESVVDIEDPAFPREPFSVITLDDGTVLVPLRDPEGNGPGHLSVRFRVNVRG